MKRAGILYIYVFFFKKVGFLRSIMILLRHIGYTEEHNFLYKKFVERAGLLLLSFV